MPLAPNFKLGPYEIKATLGAGGMGEVYRARDSRLYRDVAIKVLREDGASPDLRSRFEREARAVAALNHPNIIAVYGKDLIPTANLIPGIRFSLAPDGKSMVYSTTKDRIDLWMLTGYRRPGLSRTPSISASPTEVAPLELPGRLVHTRDIERLTLYPDR
jgi:serine/threonine protein kinase